MRWLSVLLLGLVYFLGGCAIPRTVLMAVKIREEMPVVPRGSMKIRKVESSASPEYKTPGGVIEIHSPLTAVQTYEWYRGELVRHGWTLTQSNSLSPWRNFSEWEAPVADERGEYFNSYSAERKGWWGQESIFFHLTTWDAPEGGCNLEIFFDGWYVWDTPTWVFNGMIVYPLIPVLQEGFLIVTPPLLFF